MYVILFSFITMSPSSPRILSAVSPEETSSGLFHTLLKDHIDGGFGPS